MGAPISGDVLKDLNQCRNCFIAAHSDILHDTLNAFLEGPPGCTVDYDARMLDALMDQMKQHGLLRPKPAALYRVLIHRQLASTIASFKTQKTILTFPPSLQDVAFIWSLRVQQADYMLFCSWIRSLQRIAGTSNFRIYLQCALEMGQLEWVRYLVSLLSLYLYLSSPLPLWKILICSSLAGREFGLSVPCGGKYLI
jgi:hypothetical protein